MIGLTVFSCSGAKYSYVKYPVKQDRVVINTDMRVNNDEQGEIGTKVDTLRNAYGKLVTVDGYAMVTWASTLTPEIKTGRQARFFLEGKWYWTFEEYLVNAQCKECYESNGIVVVEKAKSEEAWSRAVQWVSENSDMKIQSSTDYTVTTFDPIDATSTGHNVTRTMIGDKVTISGKILRKYGGGDLVDCSFYNWVKYGTKVSRW